MKFKKSMKSLTYLINLMKMVASLKFSQKQKLGKKKYLQMKLALVNKELIIQENNHFPEIFNMKEDK
jgi:hypothetical protein